MNVAVVIPAFRPSAELERLARALGGAGLLGLVIVDDGSGPSFASVFERVERLPGVRLIRHETNRGKGAALKTGFRAALESFPQMAGLVTADCDGQHAVNDILAVAQATEQKKDRLILGARHFGGGVPLRSRFGNVLTRMALRLVVGQRLQDTQTGLRGIPREHAQHLLSLSASGYEFELDMLVCCKHRGWRIDEVPIATLYFANNAASHFNPLRDSLRIYFSLFRFSLVALAAALIDNLAFWMAFQVTGMIAPSQVVGRLCSVAFNYGGVRRAVFFSGEPHRSTLTKYLALVVVSGTASYGLIRLMVGSTALSPIVAKMIAETMLFFVNFVVQRELIFRKSARV